MDRDGAPGNELKAPNLFTVFTSPPDEARYKSFCRQRNARVLVMNPFTWDEFRFRSVVDLGPKFSLIYY
jgi:hypothetical protein